MSQLFGFPSGLSGGSKETTYNTDRSTIVNTNYNSQFTSYFNTNAPASRSTSHVTTGNQHLVRYNGTLHEWDSGGNLIPLDWPSFGETTGGFVYWWRPNYYYGSWGGGNLPASLVPGNSMYDYLSNIEFKSQAWGHLGDWYSYNSSADSYFYNEFKLWTTSETNTISDTKNNYTATRVGDLKTVLLRLEKGAWVDSTSGNIVPNHFYPWLVLDENPSDWRANNDRYDINYFKNNTWNGNIEDLPWQFTGFFKGLVMGSGSKTLYTSQGGFDFNKSSSAWNKMWLFDMYFVYEMDLERINATWNYSANTSFTTNFGTSKLTQKNTDRDTSANTNFTTSHITYG